MNNEKKALDIISELQAFVKILEGKGYQGVHMLIGDDTGDTALNIMGYLALKKGEASWQDLHEKATVRKDVFPIYASMSIQENKPGNPLSDYSFRIDYNVKRGFHVTQMGMGRSYSDCTYTTVDVDLGVNLGRSSIPTFKKMNAFLDRADQTRRKNRQTTLDIKTNVRSVMSRGQAIKGS
ncbi:hypothetical protein ABIE26_002950 [Pedobacter africanus]|uniref:hypothetical protein n=1 Tax=Pedobacter africanus TaxID=151894 RepID=UPI0033948179